MHRQSQSSTTMPSEPSALDSESLFADEVSPLNHAREEKRSFNQAFQTLQSEANLELATLLREIHISSDAPLGSAPESRRSSELLMRAVQSAVKHYTLQAELSSLALTDELTVGVFALVYITTSDQQLANNE
jgi:hypothetical protein